jgi:hypothetical protein
MSAGPEMQDFTRLDEIVVYANHRGIGTKAAIIELVNAALSHGLGNVPKISDHRAMNAIAALMSGHEWDADTLDAIADTVRATGRTIENSDDYEDGEDV